MTARQPPSRRPGQRGFTLIELMITVAIVGILSAIAFPSYTRYILRSHRADARSALMELAQRLERRYTEQSTYAGAVLGSTGIYPAVSAQGYYSLSMTTAGDGSKYSLKATAIGNQADDDCVTLEYDSAGAKGYGLKTGVSKADCW